MLSRGFASEESIGAFTRARELFEQLGNTEQRSRHLLRAIHQSATARRNRTRAREIAAAFRSEAESAGRMTEAAVANRKPGYMKPVSREGALGDARMHFQ